MPDVPDVTALLPATQAAKYAGVSVPALLNWRRRGYCLPDGTRVYLPCTQTDEGPRYTLLDVAKAEFATRQRARR